MRDSPPDRPSAPVENVGGAPKPSYEATERERLINDIAFIVVRQHHYSKPTASDTDPSPTTSSRVAN